MWHLVKLLSTDKKSKKQVLTPLQTWDKTRRTYLSKIVNAKKAMAGYLGEVFTLHAHLLGKELHLQWKETAKQTYFTIGLKDEKGDSQTVQQGYSWAALELVLREWLLFVFTDDTAEYKHMYMSFSLKCADRMTIRGLHARMEQLNSYLLPLPCLKDSDKATSSTVWMFPFWSMSLPSLFCVACQRSLVISTSCPRILFRQLCHNCVRSLMQFAVLVKAPSF